MIDVKQMDERIAQLKDKINIVSAEINQYQKEHDDRIAPYLRDIKESEHVLMEQRENPDNIREKYRREIEQQMLALKEEMQLFKPETQFRNAKGHVIVLERTHLIKNDDKYEVTYNTAESETIHRSYTEDDLKEVMAKDKWRVASAKDFRIKAGTTFVHVVTIATPPEFKIKGGSETFYLGFTARGDAVVFSTNGEIEPEKLPKKDNPAIHKIKIMKGRHSWRDSRPLYRIPHKGEKMERWERKLHSYTTVHKAIDCRYQEEITEYLL